MATVRVVFGIAPPRRGAGLWRDPWLGGVCALLLLTSACAPVVTGAGATPTPAGSGVRPFAPITPNARPTPSDENSSLVVAADRFFVPDVIEVKVGTTVTWRSEGQEVHNIIADGGSFRSPDLATDNTFFYTFMRPGRYRYVCAYHVGDGMFGWVDVK